MSILLHPDKNKPEEKEIYNIKFRNLVSVYETLKDASKREKYDNVLKNGLPNWKSAVYYYRRARKMGLAEMSLILFVILTVGQYLVSWAVYLEKKFTMEQIFESKVKKLKKSNVNIDQILNEIPTPSIKNTLPFQIPYAIYAIITGTPGAIKGSINLVADMRKKELEKKQKWVAREWNFWNLNSKINFFFREEEEEKLIKQLEEERIKEKEERKEGLRRRKEKRETLPEKTEEELAAYSATIIKNKGDQKKVKAPLNGGLWTDDDLQELVRLTKKYPGGASNRWETIAEAMNRNVTEVTFMAYKLKDTVYKVPGETDKLVEQIKKDTIKKIKTKVADTDVDSGEKNWSQEQQKALEAAIQKNPKRGAEDRWQKIANSVPGKTKEECQSR